MYCNIIDAHLPKLITSFRNPQYPLFLRNVSSVSQNKRMQPACMWPNFFTSLIQIIHKATHLQSPLHTSIIPPGNKQQLKDRFFSVCCVWKLSKEKGLLNEKTVRNQRFWFRLSWKFQVAIGFFLFGAPMILEYFYGEIWKWISKKNFGNAVLTNFVNKHLSQ